MGDEKHAVLSYAYQKNTTQNTIEKLLEWNAQSQSKQLDLSKKKLVTLPDKIYDLKHLQFVSLEGNEIEVIPEIFSVSLFQLLWLDLRNNNLRSLPKSISKMFHLKNLLLENNKLSSLPLELGYLTSLTGLNLSNNPLVFPPKHVIEIGVKGILKFLQEKLHHQDSTENCHFDDNGCKDEMMYSSQLVSSDIRESFKNQTLNHFCDNKMVITEKSNKEGDLNKQKEKMCHQSNQQTLSKKKKNLNYKDFNINSMTHIEKKKFQNEEDSLKKFRNNEILNNWRTKKKVKRKEIQTLTSTIKINIPYSNDLPSKSSKSTVL
ncbi:leucine-rich repeat-containing protein 40 isoform X2 [Hydra vulgaris]|uniref:leucine-rich repeat-containing protein 40 isoform X2 n=1 Tax=Hydra vulgaris TaxID=6087 RepID=UPI0032EA03C1